MNRVEIKEEAKKKLEGNLWNLWKPVLIIYGISFLASFLIAILFGESVVGNALVVVANFALLPINIGLVHYYLNFVRGKNFDARDLYKFFDKAWVIICVSLLIELIVLLGSILFIIPGIIFSFMYAMCTYVLADGEDGVIDTLRASRELMNGYKFDYFKFILSFLGWLLLTIITFGIAIVYVLPYITVSQTIYYDKLKKLKK